LLAVNRDGDVGVGRDADRGQQVVDRRVAVHCVPLRTVGAPRQETPEVGEEVTVTVMVPVSVRAASLRPPIVSMLEYTARRRPRRAEVREEIPDGTWLCGIRRHDPEVIRASAREAERLGFTSFWVNHPGSTDGLAALAHAARETGASSSASA